MTRQEREASITPKLVRSLIIVAAQRGFFEAQKTIRRELQETDWKKRVEADCKLHGEEPWRSAIGGPLVVAAD